MNLIKWSSCNIIVKNIKVPNRKTCCDILICFEMNNLNMPAYKLHQQKFYYSEMTYAL